MDRQKVGWDWRANASAGPPMEATTMVGWRGLAAACPIPTGKIIPQFLVNSGFESCTISKAGRGRAERSDGPGEGSREL